MCHKEKILHAPLELRYQVSLVSSWPRLPFFLSRRWTPLRPPHHRFHPHLLLKIKQLLIQCCIKITGSDKIRELPMIKVIILPQQGQFNHKLISVRKNQHKSFIVTLSLPSSKRASFFGGALEVCDGSGLFWGNQIIRQYEVYIITKHNDYTHKHTLKRHCKGLFHFSQFTFEATFDSDFTKLLCFSAEKKLRIYISLD